MAESFDIDFSTTGQSEVVRAFEDLKIKELEAKQETSKLSTELRKLKRSGDATASEINDLSRSLVRAKAASARYSTQAASLTRVQETQGASITAGGRKFGELGGAMGNVGAVLGNISPQFGRLGGIIGQVGSAAGALSTSMGPVGVAIGVATAVVGIGAAAWQIYESETSGARVELERAAQAAREAHVNVDQLTRSLTRQRRQRNIASGRATQRAIGQEIGDLAEGRARGEAYQARLGQNVSALRGRDAELNEERRRYGLTPERSSAIALERRELTRMIGVIEEARAESESRTTTMLAQEGRLRLRQLEYDTEDAAAAEAEAAEAAEDARREAAAAARRGGGGGRGGGRGDSAALAQARRDAAEQQRIEMEIAQVGAQIDAERAARKQAAFEGDQQQRQAALQDEIRVVQEASRVQAAALAERARAEEVAATERLARQQELAQITNQAWTDVGSTMKAGLGQAFAFIQKGNEATGEGFLRLLDGFLEATAQEYGLKALIQVGEAIAAAASYRYEAAASHAAAAAIYGAVAVAAGAGGAAINVSPPSPGSGTGQQAVQPTQALGGGGGQNVTLNLYAPQAVMTERERGEIFANGVRAARRELGPSAARI